MTADLLTQQAAIKSRRQIVRDPSGQFIRPGKALELKLAAERMKAILILEVDALDHAAHRVRVKPHYRPLPGAKLHSIESVSPVAETVDPLPLFHVQVAA